MKKREDEDETDDTSDIEEKIDKMSSKKTDDVDDMDFSFKDIEREIENAVEQRKKKTGPDEFKIEHITDKIRFAKQIKEEPPAKGFMDIGFHDAEVTGLDDYGDEIKKRGIAVVSEHINEVGKKIKKIAVYDGIFNIDLNADAYFWFVRSCNVFPLILDQGIRTHVDIKKAHEPEKRRAPIPWLLIGLGIAGFVFIVLILRFLFMK